MQKYIKISKYHFGIIVAYLIAIPLLWFFFPQVFQYQYNGDYLLEVLLLIFFSLLGFGIYSHFFKKRKIQINLHYLFTGIPLLLIYSLFFAIPEEIIFRGIIQTYIRNQLTNAQIAIMLSSLIFGAVHLPNGAKGISFSKWNWQFAVIAFLGGLIFGSIYALTNTLLISTILHTLFLFMLMLKAKRNKI